jgi:hypothetical protein
MNKTACRIRPRPAHSRRLFVIPFNHFVSLRFYVLHVYSSVHNDFLRLSPRISQSILIQDNLVDELNMTTRLLCCLFIGLFDPSVFFPDTICEVR